MRRIVKDLFSILIKKNSCYSLLNVSILFVDFMKVYDLTVLYRFVVDEAAPAHPDVVVHTIEVLELFTMNFAWL